MHDQNSLIFASFLLLCVILFLHTAKLIICLSYTCSPHFSTSLQIISFLCDGKWKKNNYSFDNMFPHFFSPLKFLHSCVDHCHLLLLLLLPLLGEIHVFPLGCTRIEDGLSFLSSKKSNSLSSA